jgi:hypothetical protein
VKIARCQDYFSSQQASFLTQQNRRLLLLG